MPFLAAIPAIVPALIGAAATTAIGIDSAVNAPSGPNVPTKPVQAAVAAPTQQQTAAITQNNANNQNNTGGFTLPSYTAGQDQTLFPGINTQGLVDQAYGQTAPAQTGGGGGGSLASIINSYLTSGGGGAPGGAATNSLIQQNFSGFST